MAKKKFYVVWKGKKTGIFTSWDTCKKQVDGFVGAQYKSFLSKAEADLAFSKTYKDYKGINTKTPVLSEAEKAKYGTPIVESLTVDAACSGNPGVMEYRGVLNSTKKELFKIGPLDGGTNNIGEFLALVHGISFLKKHNKPKFPIYSDSKIAMAWLKQKQCRTNLVFDGSNKELLALIKRAEDWLQKNSYQNPILKWETKAWGEIPADFGRK